MNDAAGETWPFLFENIIVKIICFAFNKLIFHIFQPVRLFILIFK